MANGVLRTKIIPAKHAASCLSMRLPETMATKGKLRSVNSPQSCGYLVGLDDAFLNQDTERKYNLI